MTFSPEELALLAVSDRLVNSRARDPVMRDRPSAKPKSYKMEVPWVRLQLLMRHHPYCVSGLAHRLGVNPAALAHHLNRLQREGRVRRVNNLWSIA